MLTITSVIERILGLQSVVGWSFDLRPGSTQPGDSSGPNVFQKLIGWAVLICIAILAILIQNFLIGFIAFFVLVHIFGLNFFAFYSIFPATFVYLTFFNRLDIVGALWMLGARFNILLTAVLMIALVLPAAFYLTRYGVAVAASISGIEAPDYANLVGARDYLMGFMDQQIVASSLIGIFSLVYMRHAVVGAGLPTTG